MARRSRFIAFGLLLGALALTAPINAHADPYTFVCLQARGGDSSAAELYAGPCVFFDSALPYVDARPILRVDSPGHSLVVIGDVALIGSNNACLLARVIVDGSEQLPGELSGGTCLP